MRVRENHPHSLALSLWRRGGDDSFSGTAALYCSRAWERRIRGSRIRGRVLPAARGKFAAAGIRGDNKGKMKFFASINCAILYLEKNVKKGAVLFEEGAGFF